MTSFLPQNPSQVVIRPLQYRDLDIIESWCVQTTTLEPPITQDTTLNITPLKLQKQLNQIRRWYGLLKFLRWFPNPCRDLFSVQVVEIEGQVQGMIQTSPFNRTRSTWRVDQVIVDPQGNNSGIGSQLLRFCFEAIWEARTWLLEVNVNDPSNLALYRQNGFQPLAQMTYWAIDSERLQALAGTQPDLPNLLPISNADAQLLYQLDTASMPPLVRQVFDRHILDFKSSFFRGLLEGIRQWLHETEVISGYVFEPQRKAAIGYFQVQLSRNGEQPHIAQLTVHPAYTWLYPELMAQMARLAQEFPGQSLHLASADYQPEREAYLEEVGAKRIAHTLLMSRSVWHKLRESKSALEGLQLSDVLQGFQPARKPVPSRISWWGLIQSQRGIHHMTPLTEQDKKHLSHPKPSHLPGTSLESPGSPLPPTPGIHSHHEPEPNS